MYTKEIFYLILISLYRETKGSIDIGHLNAILKR